MSHDIGSLLSKINSKLGDFMNIGLKYISCLLVLFSFLSIKAVSEEEQKALNLKLENAIQTQDTEIVRGVLDEGANANALSSNEQPLIILAAQRGSLPIVELLLQHGASINTSIINERQVITPLYASLRNRVPESGSATDALEWYIARGANPNIHNGADRLTSITQDRWRERYRYLFSHGLRLSGNDLRDAVTRNMVHLIYHDRPLLEHTILQEQELAQAVLTELHHTALHDELTERNLVDINEALLLSIAQDNPVVFNNILNMFGTIASYEAEGLVLDLGPALVLAALVGNDYALSQISNYFLIPWASRPQDFTSLLNESLLVAILQKHAETVAKILSIAASKGISLRLENALQIVTSILENWGLTPSERDGLENIRTLLRERHETTSVSGALSNIALVLPLLTEALKETTFQK